MPPNIIHKNFYNATALLPPTQESVSKSDIEESSRRDTWRCPASEKSLRTRNPIRAIVDPIVANSIKSGEERGDGKDHISLALGDPTAYGNLPPCQAATDAIVEALQSQDRADGYVNACGTPEARTAIAQYHSSEDMAVSSDQVVVANGCSGALELALTALLDPGTVLLVPNPGFPLYQVIAESHGASVVSYNLLPDHGWECDIHHMEQTILQYPPGVVRGIVVNNPSNPTGSVYAKDHLQRILQLARRFCLPIVADEVYGDLTFGDNVFHPLALVAAQSGRNVPVITASGLGKQYLLPGWRIGWIVLHDSHNRALCEVEAGVKRLGQVILGASHLAQSAIPALLAPKTEAKAAEILTWKSNIIDRLQGQAFSLCSALSKCKGLSVLEPQGAMYAMVRVDLELFDTDISDDCAFTELLLEEENVFVLPGRAFGISSDCVFRVVFCAPTEILEEAALRIANFCRRHSSD